MQEKVGTRASKRVYFKTNTNYYILQINLPKDQRRPWPEPPKALADIPITGTKVTYVFRYDLW